MDPRAHERLLLADRIARMEMQGGPRGGGDDEDSYDRLLNTVIQTELANSQSRGADHRRFQYGQMAADAAARRGETAAEADAGRRETFATAEAGRGREAEEFKYGLHQDERDLAARAAEVDMERLRAETEGTRSQTKLKELADSKERRQENLAAGVLTGRLAAGESVSDRLAEVAGADPETYRETGVPRAVREARAAELAKTGNYDEMAQVLRDDVPSNGLTQSELDSPRHQERMDEAVRMMNASPDILDQLRGVRKPYQEEGFFESGYPLGPGTQGYFNMYKMNRKQAMVQVRALKKSHPGRFDMYPDAMLADKLIAAD